jgi:hypothetical protein
LSKGTLQKRKKHSMLSINTCSRPTRFLRRPTPMLAKVVLWLSLCYG